MAIYLKDKSVLTEVTEVTFVDVSLTKNQEGVDTESVGCLVVSFSDKAAQPESQRVLVGFKMSDVKADSEHGYIIDASDAQARHAAIIVDRLRSRAMSSTPSLAI